MPAILEAQKEGQNANLIKTLNILLCLSLAKPNMVLKQSNKLQPT